MNERFTSANAREVSRFDATLLHELRTPLNQILGYTEMMLEQTAEPGDHDFAPDLRHVHAAGHLLLSIIDANGQDKEPVTPAVSQIYLSKPECRPSEKPTTPVSDVSGTFLVVDDIETNRDVLSRRLERQGHTVMTAENGRAALEMLREHDFDLVLLDIMMPEMDGYETLRILKADQALSHIPVIMISALHELKSVLRCIEMGADDYLSKPFEPALLKARISACLDKKLARDREVELYRRLQENYTKLQEAERQRDDLISMIVHDLRSPLTSVMAGMQTMDMVGDLNVGQQEMVEISMYGARQLLDIINDLLDVHKMEAGQMPLDRALVSTSDLIEGAASQVDSLAVGRKITVIRQMDPDMPVLWADGKKLRRILVNLLANAIKFTPPHGTVKLAVALDEAAWSLVFSVSDTGEGIPAESFEHIFEKFGQLESKLQKRSLGTGLGLAFCKLAVETHGGIISVESTLGQGSTFSFTIPILSKP